jgi:DNA-directed RNA polymerase omega subunit
MTEQKADSTTVATADQQRLSAIVDSRFMFVDVAALRAKQLRRGALPRISAEHHDTLHKLERVAMEEVRKGLVDYTVPEWKPRPPVEVV